jgi:hypothetical protein
MFEKLKEKMIEYNIKRKNAQLKKKYKRSYGYNRLYIEYKILDVLIVYLEEVGVKYYDKDYSIYTSKITFNDNTIFTFFNDGIPKSSFMSNGSISFSNGENLKWERKSPSYEVLYKYMIEIKKLEETKDDEDFSKYLPIQLQRKLKLKKLK